MSKMQNVIQAHQRKIQRKFMDKRDGLLVTCKGALKNWHKGNYHQKPDEIARCEQAPIGFFPDMKKNVETRKDDRHAGKPATIKYQNYLVVNVE
jgi:hypothetical protein